MAITGIVMMAYADGFHGDSFVGVALAVGSASTSALYKVRVTHSMPAQALVLQKHGNSSHPGAAEDVSGQRQPRRGGSLSLHDGRLQPGLHLWRAAHSLLYQGGALGLAVVTAVGVHVRPGRTVAGWACTKSPPELRKRSFPFHVSISSASITDCLS